MNNKQKEKLRNGLANMGHARFEPAPVITPSALEGLPENMPLYKDSGLWQLRTEDMNDVVIQQGVNESDELFLQKCRSYHNNIIRELMLGMTKEQAIAAMEKGERVTHEYFGREEWVTIQDGTIVSEDNVKHPEFWKIRKDNCYERGWSIFQKEY